MAGFIRFEGFAGDAGGEDRVGWSTVTSFEQVFQPPSEESNADAPGEGLDPEPLLVQKHLDAASVWLQRLALSGQPVGRVVFELTRKLKSGGEAVVYRVEMEGAQIVEYALGGRGGLARAPVEELALSWQRLKATWWDVSRKGRVRGETTLIWPSES